jgi:Putative Ig domain
MLGLKGAIAGVGVALLFAAAPTGGSAQSAPQPSGLQHVTLIGDSVADALAGDQTAEAIVSQGIDLDLELAPCRRVDQESCPYLGVRPPNVVQLAQSMGSKLGPDVIVAVGYNDFADQYAQNIENALAAFKAAGVQRVFWLTLREAHHPYIDMNDEIVAAAQDHPELTVIDWNMYSRSHPDWFQSDGLHLLAAGAEGMATLIHNTLVGDGVAPRPVAITTSSLPAAHRLRRYTSQLRATGGVGPFKWSLLERAPAGLHLLASGVIQGKARANPGNYVFDVHVVDAGGDSETRDLTIRITR